MFDPQLLEKNPTKLRISKISYCNTFPRAETKPQEAQARFARARLCLPYNEGRKETLRPK